MNDHLNSAGLLEHLMNGELTPKKICEPIQTLFVAMNKVQELVASRLGSKTKVVLTLLPGYAGDLCRSDVSLDSERQRAADADGSPEL